MFGSQILEVVIGLVFVYLILSLICSAVNEWIASRLKMRAKCLEKAIKNLLCDPNNAGVEKLFYNHRLIRGLMDGDKLPSYIPSNTFASVLLDIIEKVTTTSGDEKNILSDLKDSKLKDVLINFSHAAKNNLAQARADIEAWFNNTMERASGWYKRKIQWFILGISFGVSGFLNADSFMIANTLWRNDNIRAAVVASAQDAARNHAPAESNAPSNSIEKLRTELQTLNLPIGWVKTAPNEQRPLLDDPRAFPNDVRGRNIKS